MDIGGVRDGGETGVRELQGGECRIHCVDVALELLFREVGWHWRTGVSHQDHFWNLAFACFIRRPCGQSGEIPSSGHTEVFVWKLAESEFCFYFLKVKGNHRKPVIAIEIIKLCSGLCICLVGISMCKAFNWVLRIQQKQKHKWFPSSWGSQSREQTNIIQLIRQSISIYWACEVFQTLGILLEANQTQIL